MNLHGLNCRQKGHSKTGHKKVQVSDGSGIWIATVKSMLASGFSYQVKAKTMEMKDDPWKGRVICTLPMVQGNGK